MLDINSATYVEITLDENTIWVNVNGKCVLRINKRKILSIDDKRTPLEKREDT